MKVRGLTDTIAEPRYDTFGLTTGLSIATFFQVPVGSGATSWGTNPSAGPKSFADTNMDLPGQLPSGYAFQVQGFRLQFPWDALIVDINALLNGCFFQFFVGSKPFLTTPARNIPSGNGPWMNGSPILIASGAGSAMVSSGWPSMQNGFAIGRKPLVLGPTENFKVTLNWPGAGGAIVTANTRYAVNNTLPLTVELDGFLGRPVQ